MRFSGGTSPAEGRVYIKQGGKWGSLCDKNFGLSEAQVLCSMLGYRYILKNKAIFIYHYIKDQWLMIKKQNEDRDGVWLRSIKKRRYQVLCGLRVYGTTVIGHAQRQMIGRPNKSLGSRKVKGLERIDKIGYDHWGQRTLVLITITWYHAWLSTPYIQKHVGIVISLIVSVRHQNNNVDVIVNSVHITRQRYTYNIWKLIKLWLHSAINTFTKGRTQNTI